MSFVKGLCLGLAGCLLFFSLLVFSGLLSIKSTVLQPQFMVDELDKLDITIAAREFLVDQMLDETYVEAVDRTLIETEPWIRLQMSEAVFSSYDYLLGKSRTFRITLNLDPLRKSLVDNLTGVYLESPPAEYLALSPSEQENYLTDLRQDTLDLIPSTLEINKDNLGEDIMSNLKQAKEAVSFINAAFWGLLAAVIMLALLLIIFLRKTKGILITFGIIFVVDGALIILAKILFQNSVYPGLAPVDLIPELQVWITQLMKDIVFPWQVCGISLLASGVLALAAGCFFFKGTRAAF
jgi:hypothetical protein